MQHDREGIIHRDEWERQQGDSILRSGALSQPSHVAKLASGGLKECLDAYARRLLQSGFGLDRFSDALGKNLTRGKRQIEPARKETFQHLKIG
jgi:hypothetical protein